MVMSVVSPVNQCQFSQDGKRRMTVLDTRKLGIKPGLVTRGLSGIVWIFRED